MSVVIVVLLVFILFTAFVVNGNVSRIADQMKRANDNTFGVNDSFYPAAPEASVTEPPAPKPDSERAS